MDKYAFKLEKDMGKIPNGSSLICRIGEDPIVVYGKLRALFGNPSYETENLENQYSYCLSMKGESGKELFLEVYSGGSGPAIAGLQGEEYKKAAEQLIEMIQKAAPVDFDYEGYYMDIPIKVSQGIKNGVPYIREEELNLSDQEFEELYKKLYNL